MFEVFEELQIVFVVMGHSKRKVVLLLVASGAMLGIICYCTFHSCI